MDLVELLKVLVRQWWVAFPIMVLALTVALLIEREASDTYAATGSVVISEASVDPSQNPSVITRPPLVARELRLSDEFESTALADETSELTVEVIEPDGIEIQVVGASEAQMDERVTALADWAAEYVSDAQGEVGVPEAERISAELQRVDVVPTGTAPEDGQSFTATAVLLFDDPMADVTNPLAADLSTARMLQVSAMSDAGRQAVFERTDGDVDYEVSQDSNDRAPILEIVTYASSESRAVATFEDVVDVLADDFDDRQASAGVRSAERLSLEVLAAPLRARDVSPPVSRAVVVVLALGVLLALVGAVLLENLRSRRHGDAVAGAATYDRDAALFMGEGGYESEFDDLDLGPSDDATYGVTGAEPTDNARRQ
jgi:capsular polysaccharide biosynthesis protein